MMDWGNGGWSAGDWVAMSTMMILFWGVLVAVVVWVVRTMCADRGSTGSADRADVMLAERFARGEIDGEEFTRSRELLHGTGSTKLHGRS
ncbi:MAG: SHOCT domain-containing protein [Actinomycetota bacterium]|nr:SHOCT domain-containing protein [Actinomycetota bacterium]